MNARNTKHNYQNEIFKLKKIMIEDNNRKKIKTSQQHFRIKLKQNNNKN